jgi:DNA-directed RNA polymerase subunit alpha
MLVMQRPTIEAVSEESGNRQRFAVGPLEPGFGHTLGNSLRRTLLSSIPGAAITMVRFDDALHEFDTIQGVAEDVTDIILNLKDVVVTSESSDPVTCRLDVKGAAVVTAADIECPADVEVLNKDLVIATLNGKGRIAIDLTVEQGRGYSSSDRDTENRTIGVIPVDAIFSPVRRVTFEVEPTRVEQSDELRPPRARRRDRRLDHPRRGAGLAGATLRSLADLVAVDERRAAGPRARRGRRRRRQLARPRAPDRGPRPVGAAVELPQAGADQHDRRAADEDRGRPPEHHQLRAEEPGRGQAEARRARPVAARLTEPETDAHPTQVQAPSAAAAPTSA